MWLINRACEIQLASKSMGEVIDLPVAVLEKCVADSLNFDPKYGAGEDAFAAFVRLVEKQDPGFRH